MSRRRSDPRKVPHPPPGSAPERPQWLSRVLARAGALAPGEIDQAVRAGRVSVAGRPARGPMTLVGPGDAVRLDGRLVPFRAKTLALMFHKPAGVVVAADDPEGRGTAFGLLIAALPPALSRIGWHAVGRLDRDTTGLLLFTNDERLVGFATQPQTHLPKRYLAQVQGVPTEERLEPLRRGQLLDDGPCRPAEARLRAPGLVELTLTEGRHHQVKRMLGAIGLPVRRLHREAVGTLLLDLPEGAWRSLTDAEIAEGLGFRPR